MNRGELQLALRAIQARKIRQEAQQVRSKYGASASNSVLEGACITSESSGIDGLNRPRSAVCSLDGKEAVVLNEPFC